MSSRCLWMPLRQGRILRLWNQHDAQVCLLLCALPTYVSDSDPQHHFWTHWLHLFDRLNFRVLLRLIPIVSFSSRIVHRI
jgi:hypothetical protein